MGKLPEWDNYATQQEWTEPDQLERPPLTGAKRYVPDGLYDQPWEKATDAYGPATLTPYYIEALTSDDDGDVSFGVYGLYSATTHQGSVYQASLMAIPFLVDLLKLDNAAEMACLFLARIALGEHHFISAPSEVYHTRYFRSVSKYRGEIKAYYHRTGSEEAMRLLCFLRGMLPDRLDFSWDTVLSLTKGDQRAAYPRQASALIAQGFLAAKKNYPQKGWPPSALDISPDSIKVAAHVQEARELMEGSPSLLVRGSAAVCLAYTGIVDDEILDLLGELGEQELTGVPWVWDEFSDLCRRAWLYSADLDTLLNSSRFLTLDYTITKDGVETPQNSPSERLVTAAGRLFPGRFSGKEQNPPLLPNALNSMQQKALRRIVEAAPHLLGGYDTVSLNIPTSVWAAKRLLQDSEEALCADAGGVPLWHLLERCVLENTPDQAVKALTHHNAWGVLTEIYQPVREGQTEERCSLSIENYYDEGQTARREQALASLLADALVDYEEKMLPFLDQWLGKAGNLQEYDWKFETKGQRIGICMLALVRAGKWDGKYEPLVRPYHPVARFSTFPIPLLKEILNETTSVHQKQIHKQFDI